MKRDTRKFRLWLICICESGTLTTNACKEQMALKRFQLLPAERSKTGFGKKGLPEQCNETTLRVCYDFLLKTQTKVSFPLLVYLREERFLSYATQPASAEILKPELRIEFTTQSVTCYSHQGTLNVLLLSRALQV